METSRSEPVERELQRVGAPPTIHTDPSPSDTEAAAIVAALEAYLMEEQAHVDGDGDESPPGWRTAARLEAIGHPIIRSTAQLPRNPWRAAQRRSLRR